MHTYFPQTCRNYVYAKKKYALVTRINPWQESSIGDTYMVDGLYWRGHCKRRISNQMLCSNAPTSTVHYPCELVKRAIAILDDSLQGRFTMDFLIWMVHPVGVAVAQQCDQTVVQVGFGACSLWRFPAPEHQPAVIQRLGVVQEWNSTGEQSAGHVHGFRASEYFAAAVLGQMQIA